MMHIDDRIKTLHSLVKCLSDRDQNLSGPDFFSRWDAAVSQEVFYHSWFVPSFVHEAVDALVYMLEGSDGKALERWIQPYLPALEAKTESRRTGVVMAGNIPLVGFHDFLCTFMAGDVFIGKMSSHDNRLWPLLFELMTRINPESAGQLQLTTGKLGPVDRIIATGSNNSARYFDYYFGKYPCIIRRHCNGTAVLDGRESAQELSGLARDICLYFGMGCRSVAKIYVPRAYDFAPLFHALDEFKPIFGMHHSYLNNLEYQKTVHLINSIPFLDQGICMFKESEAFASPVGVVHYAYYDSLPEVWKEVDCDEVQCVVTHLEAPLDTVLPGCSQRPELGQYANGLDTMAFLLDPHPKTERI